MQISTAGKEASGTSNMKFALNGSLTIGTLDGANVEIRDEVGPDNFLLFGLNADQVVRLRQEGYDPQRAIAGSPRLNEVIALIESGFFSFGDPDRFRRIVEGLRTSDPYMVCADFEDYLATEARAAELYRDPLDWSRRTAFNIAGASRFSSDETIRQYASDIWSLQPVAVDLGELADSGS